MRGARVAYFDPKFRLWLARFVPEWGLVSPQVRGRTRWHPSVQYHDPRTTSTVPTKRTSPWVSRSGKVRPAKSAGDIRASDWGRYIDAVGPATSTKQGCRNSLRQEPVGRLSFQVSLSKAATPTSVARHYASCGYSCSIIQCDIRTGSRGFSRTSRVAPPRMNSRNREWPNAPMTSKSDSLVRASCWSACPILRSPRST